jgi:pilus assembly protein Flp/PilA
MSFAMLQLRTWLTAAFADRDDRGASVVEYAMLLALIAMVCLVAVNLVGDPVSEGLSNGGNGFRP